MNDCQASPRLELKKNGPAYGTIAQLTGLVDVVFTCTCIACHVVLAIPPVPFSCPPSSPHPATIEVPPEKRRKLIGSGGHRIQSLVSETGAEVHTVSDEQMSVFAPTSEAMEDLMERIEAILQEEDENEVMLSNTPCTHVYSYMCVEDSCILLSKYT